MSKKRLSDDRMNIIAQNGNEGLHYEKCGGDISITCEPIPPLVDALDQRDKAAERKATPIYSAFEFFPDAMWELGKVIAAGQNQWIDGETSSPVWDRSKSNQHMQSLTRHLVDHASGELIDDDGCYHLGKIIWRACAMLQELKEKE